MAGKLFIYDSSDEYNVDQARGRFSVSSDVTPIATDSIDGLQNRLDDLVRRRVTFDRVLFQTHGVPGAIKFAGSSVYDVTLRDKFRSRGYHTLFPTYTRLYFDGCNVAYGNFGTQFLIEAGQIFTRLGGGEVFAFTNPGYWFPFIGSQTIHIGAPLKTVYLLAGGIVVKVQQPSVYLHAIA